LSRRLLLVALALLVPAGLSTKLYAGPGAGFVRGSLGGVFYVTFWTLAALLVRPRLDPRAAAAGAFLLTCVVEVAQLWHPPLLEAARATWAGELLLGTTFSAWDFAAYATGAALGWGLAAACRA